MEKTFFSVYFQEQHKNNQVKKTGFAHFFGFINKNCFNEEV